MVYILQEMGFPFREHYRYHLYGPYARSLTDRIARLVDEQFLEETPQGAGDTKFFRYEVKPELENFLEQLDFSPERASIDLSFDDLVQEINGQTSSLLEMAATALFLNRTGISQDSLMDELQRRKPHLSKQIAPSLQFLKSLCPRGLLTLN